jgi:cysteine sulfinate desulfinase/cysteine desulfurase-like protein
LDYVMTYLDHNAATSVLSEVFEAMRPYFCEE